MDVSEITKKIDAAKTRQSQLQEQIDANFDLWRRDPPFTIDKNEGKYDNVTVNIPTTTANKIVYYLSRGTKRFICGLEDPEEAKNKREKESATERFGHGVIGLADERLANFPGVIDIQSALSFDAVVPGGVAGRVFVYEGEDGNPVWDVAIWHIRDTYWGMGSKGLAWACYCYYVSPEWAEDEFGVEVPGEGKDIEVKDFWNDEEQATVINNLVVDNKKIQPIKHNLGHPPVFIFPVGSVPRVHTGKTTDTLKYQFASIFDGARDLYPVLSKLYSYKLTTIGENAHSPIYIYYDGPNNVPKIRAGSLHQKDNTVLLDRSKGQEVVHPPQKITPADLDSMISRVEGMIEAAGIAPVLTGQSDGVRAVGTINILNKNAMTTINPFQMVVEKALGWIATEARNQYIKGEYTSIHLEGRDYKQIPFRTDISKDKLVDNQPIKCELKLNLPQDDMVNAGVELALVGGKLRSRQTAMTNTGILDPDAEKAIMNREEAENITGVKLYEFLEQLIKDGNKDGAVFVAAQIKEMVAQQMQSLTPQPGSPQDIVPRPGMPQGIVPRPALGTMTQGLTPSPENQRLGNMGLVRGR